MPQASDDIIIRPAVCLWPSNRLAENEWRLAVSENVATNQSVNRALRCTTDQAVPSCRDPIHKLAATILALVKSHPSTFWLRVK